MNSSPTFQPFCIPSDMKPPEGVPHFGGMSSGMPKALHHPARGLLVASYPGFGSNTPRTLKEFNRERLEALRCNLFQG